MQIPKRNYDRLLTLSFAFLTISISAVLLMKSFSIGEKFSTREFSRSPLPYIEINGTADAIAHLKAGYRWDPPVAENGRVVTALASAPVFIHNGKLVEGYGGAPVRGDVPNRWLIENGLPISRSDVLQLDHDGDKFSNGEEYRLGQTDPNDAGSHPDVLHKLRLAGVNSEDYVLMFAAGTNGNFNLRRIKDVRLTHWRDWFEVGDRLPGDRFELVAGDEKSVTIREVSGDGEFVLEVGVKKNLPIYSAKLKYLMEPLPKSDAKLARGEQFNLGRSGIRCTIEGVTPEAVKLAIVRPDGQSERLVLKAEQ